MRKSKHLLAALACVLALETESIAQEPVRNLELEAGAGPTMAITKGERYGCPFVFLELRSNLHNSRFDIGSHIAISATLLADINYEPVPGAILPNRYDEYIIYMMPVADYNFHRGKRISYFVGGGAGISICEIERNTRGSFALMPRVGVEFFNHLRLTLNYKYNQRGVYHYLGLSIGGVIGGGRKQA